MSRVLTEEEFCEYIEKIKIFHAYEQDIYMLSKEYCEIMKNGEPIGFYPTMEDVVIDLLEEIFCDKEDGWIAWWVYESNFGHDNPIVEIDNREYYIDTANKLYYVLIDQLEEIEDE